MAGLGAWKLMTVGTNLFKFQQATAVVASTEAALTAMSNACQTYPQGGACYSLPVIEQQLYQCRVTQARFGTAILWGDPQGIIPSRPIMPGDKLFLR